jgi:acyl-coenzyme A synthetase/AMP-(fatty) acid ligase
MSATREQQAASAAASGPPETGEPCVVRLFENVVARYHDQVAVRAADHVWTYAGLNTAANNVAHALLSTAGTGPEPVAILVEHDSLAIVGMFGALKTGRPHFVLPTGAPDQRITSIWEDAQPAALISVSALKPVVERLFATVGIAPVVYIDEVDLVRDAPDPGIYPPALTPYCILYTSGSTGQPKGILIDHRVEHHWVAERTFGRYEAPGVPAGLVSPISFAAPKERVLQTLQHGATLCVFDFAAQGPAAAADWLRSEHIQVLRTTTSIFRLIFEHLPEGAVLPDLRLVHMGGAPAHSRDFELFKAHTHSACQFSHGFANSESGSLTYVSLGHDAVVEEGALPAGYLVGDAEILLLDDNGSPVAAGEVGEIVVRGAYLPVGYWRRPDLTASRWSRDPKDPSLRLAYIGDLGRWRPDGMLEFVGRKDWMVKINGQRVELGEVEAQLLSNPQVRDAAVAARPVSPGSEQLRLVGYIVPAQGAAPTTSALRSFLGQRLPAYMVPSTFLFLEALPRLDGTKLNRNALPEPPPREAPAAEEMPGDELEARLVEIWSSLLHVDGIGVHEDFFELGGDSLSVLSMMLDVERLAGRPVPRDFFRTPTVRGLASLLQRPEEESSENEEDDFQLAGAERSAAALHVARRNRLRTVVVTLREWAKNLRKSVEAFDLLEWFWSRRVRRMGFFEARRLLLRLSDQHMLLSVLYWRRKRLLRRYLASLGVPAGDLRRRVRHSFLAGFMSRLVGRQADYFGGEGSAFVRDRQRLIADTPLERLQDDFPVIGLEHVEAALRGGQGAILVTFHGGAAGRPLTELLSRRLGGAKIQGLTQRRAEASSGFAGKRDLMEPAVAGSVYAELAYYGQLLLRQGRIVRIAGDTFAPGPGAVFEIRVGDRRYEIKPGFAELALNSGAPVIPFGARVLENGRILTEFESPLDPGRGTREDQIRALVDQYESYLNRVLAGHPEIRRWKTMTTHLRRKRVHASARPTPALVQEKES